MIKNKIAQFIEGQNLTPYAFIQRTGLSAGTVYRLKNNPDQQPAYTTMDAICSTFPGTVVSDLIEYAGGCINS